MIDQSRVEQFASRLLKKFFTLGSYKACLLIIWQKHTVTPLPPNHKSWIRPCVPFLCVLKKNCSSPFVCIEHICVLLCVYWRNIVVPFYMYWTNIYYMSFLFICMNNIFFLVCVHNHNLINMQLMYEVTVNIITPFLNWK